MSIYSQDDERNIRVQRLVADWHASGLITAEQRDRMLPELDVDLRRTNLFLRVTLFVFGCVIIGAAFGLVIVTLSLEDSALTVTSFVASALLFAAAQWMIEKYRLYHFGVEEAVAVSAASYFGIAGATLFDDRFMSVYAFAALTIGTAVVFRRFGYVYAAIGAVFFATCFVFDIEQSDTFRRLFAAILLLTIYFFARERRQDHEWDFPADTLAVIEAVAWAALYLITNVKISSWVSVPDGYQFVYWTTYVLIWVLPAAGLWLAIRDRHRLMLDVNIVLAIITLSSNKPYLGAPQQPWDPIAFGVMLIAVSLGLRRWIASGPQGARGAFVAHRLLESEKATLSMAGSATVLAPGAPAPSTRTPEPPPSFGGGRSGGAGASGSF